MSTIALTPELEAWAQAEVAAGRAASVEQAVLGAITAHRNFIRTLEEAEAEAERDGWLDVDDVFTELNARYPDSN
jgi:hypothetical protein